MTHEPRYSDEDPTLQRLRELALSFPGADEKISHGRPVFFTTKVFVWYGMSNKVDGEWVQHPQSVCVLLPEEERLAVRGLPHCWVPGYLGPYGWLVFEEVDRLFCDLGGGEVADEVVPGSAEAASDGAAGLGGAADDGPVRERRVPVQDRFCDRVRCREHVLRHVAFRGVDAGDVAPVRRVVRAGGVEAEVGHGFSPVWVR